MRLRTALTKASLRPTQMAEAADPAKSASSPISLSVLTTPAPKHLAPKLSTQTSAAAAESIGSMVASKASVSSESIVPSKKKTSKPAATP